MTTWVQQHFRDAQRARETLAVTVVAAGLIGFGLVMLGVFLSR